MVNYHGNQKAVVRVNPLISLQALIPVICDKCEFDPTRVLLLKDSISQRELPLDKTLAELGIKDLYVHDQRLGKPDLISLCEICQISVSIVFPVARKMIQILSDDTFFF